MKGSLWRLFGTAFIGITYSDRLGPLDEPTLVDLRATVVGPAEQTAPISGERVVHYRLEIGARVDANSTLPTGVVPVHLLRFELLAERTSDTDLVLRTSDDAVLRMRASEFVVVARHPEGGQDLSRAAMDRETAALFAGRSVLDVPAYRETTLAPGDEVTFTAVLHPPRSRGGSAYRVGGAEETFTLEPGQPVIVVEKLPKRTRASN